MHRTGADAYEVGRGKPPTATRFQKGQSGNPKGRPKGLSVKEMFMRIANQAIHDAVAKQWRLAPGSTPLDMVMTELFNKATKRDIKAVRHVLTMQALYFPDAEVSAPDMEVRGPAAG